MLVFNNENNITYKQSCLTQIKDYTMWTTPAATEMRFGMEITAYVMNK